MSGSGALLGEVRGFIAGLRAELPELFEAPSGPERFAARCALRAAEMGVAFGRVRVKEMSSLWGSCSARGDLSFNRRLLDAPPAVLDYVVVHELAHLRWRGHGRRFWGLVARHCPAAGTSRRWLKANGPALLRGELPGPAAADGEDPQVPGGLARQGEVEAPGLGVGPAAV